MFELLRREFRRPPWGPLGYLFMRPGIRRIRRRFDYERLGGAPLLGVNGTVLITHGSARRRMIGYAVDVTAAAARARIPERIAAALAAEPSRSTDALDDGRARPASGRIGRAAGSAGPGPQPRPDRPSRSGDGPGRRRTDPPAARRRASTSPSARDASSRSRRCSRPTSGSAPRRPSWSGASARVRPRDRAAAHARTHRRRGDPTPRQRSTPRSSAWRPPTRSSSSPGSTGRCLRCGVGELLHCPATPARVAISEWVELARTYSGEPTRRLMNGALGASGRGRDRAPRERQVIDDRARAADRAPTTGQTEGAPE